MADIVDQSTDERAGRGPLQGCKHIRLRIENTLAADALTLGLQSIQEVAWCGDDVNDQVAAEIAAPPAAPGVITLVGNAGGNGFLHVWYKGY